MTFDALLSRADEHTLQAILGAPAIRLMMLLDQTLATPTRLRELLLRMRQPEDLLLDRSTRDMLLDLLRPDEADILVQALDIALGSDPYATLRGRRFTRGSSRERVLLNFFELSPPPQDVQMLAPDVEPLEAAYPLFSHQRRAAREVSQLLAEEPHRVLLHMPTGSGKTRTAMNVIAEHLRQREPGVVVWLAHSEELCDQAVDEFGRAWGHVGNRAVSVHRFWGPHDIDLDSLTDGLVVAGLAKLFAAAKRDLQVLSRIGQQTSLIVMDEAHQAVAATYKLVLDALFALGRNTGLLGLTATPGRTWSDISTDRELSAFFAECKVTLQVPGYENPVDYLVAEGYLARTEFRPLLHSGSYDPSPADLRRIRDELDIPAAVLEALGEMDQRNLAIVQEVAQLLSSHNRIILFAASVEHARTITSALTALGHRASCVTGLTASHTRQKLLDEYRSDADEPIVICNFGVLTMGFDAPATSAVVIARPTKSLVLYSQMVGRAIRGPRAGGNESAEIVTVVDRHLPGFGCVVDAFENWEDVWTPQ